MAVVKDFCDFDKIFSAFKRSCNDVQNAEKVHRRILQKLQEKGLVCTGDEPIKIADIGCGPADTLITNLRNINFKPGFDIRGTDIDPMYACDQVDNDDMNVNQSQDRKGLAVQTLLAAKHNQEIPIRNYSIKQGNIFQSNLLNLLSVETDIEKEKNTFAIVYASHSLYYSQAYGAAMAGITKNLINCIASEVLSQNGIAVSIHACIKPKSIGLMFHRFTFKIIEECVPSQEEYLQHSPDSVIANCCNELGLSVFTVPVLAKLEFSDSVFDYADVFKNPDRYDELSENDAATNDLYKMLFLAHKSPNELYYDKSQYGLTNLVDETLAILRKDGCMHSYLALQIIVSKNASEKFKEEVAAVVKTVSADLTDTI